MIEGGLFLVGRPAVVAENKSLNQTGVSVSHRPARSSRLLVVVVVGVVVGVGDGITSSSSRQVRATSFRTPQEIRTFGFSTLASNRRWAMTVWGNTIDTNIVVFNSRRKRYSEETCSSFFFSNVLYMYSAFWPSEAVRFHSMAGRSKRFAFPSRTRTWYIAT
jgi:hypothetical protein